MGCGKSFHAKNLSKIMKIPAIDIDEYIEKKTGRTISEIFEQFGESEFRKLESNCLKEISDTDTNLIIATGGGTACSIDNMEIINKSGISIFIDTDIEILADRLSKEIVKRPLLKDLDKSSLVDFINLKLESRLKFYNCCKYKITDNGYLESKDIYDIIK